MNFAIDIRELKLRFDKPWKTIWYFCLPSVVIMVIQGCYNIIDKVLALKFAAADLVKNQWYINEYQKLNPSSTLTIKNMERYINIATHYASQTYNLMWAFAIMAAIGCALNFSIAFGTRDRKQMAEIAGNGFVFIVILSCIVSFFTFVINYPGFDAIFVRSQMGANYNAIIEKLAWEFSYPMIFAAPLMFLSYYFLTLIRSEGRMSLVIASILTAMVINCIAAIFFMHVCHLGVTGAMLGTVCSWITQIIWGAIIIFKFKNSHSKFKFTNIININKSNFWNFTKVGFPNFIANFAFVITSYVATSLIIKLPVAMNEISLEADGVSILQQLMAALTPWMTLIISVGVGITQGARTIIAYNYGAKKYERIWHILIRVSMLLIAWFTFVICFIIAFGDVMIIQFSFPSEYASKYRWWLVLSFSTYPFCAVTYICLTLFQGTNRSALSTFSNSLRAFIVALPCLGVGYLIATKTNNAIYYFLCLGLNDLVCALILIPMLINFYNKHKNHLQDTYSDEDLVYLQKQTQNNN